MPNSWIDTVRYKWKSFRNEYRKGTFSFACLNTAQFFGALNDNIYKLLVIFFLLSISDPNKQGLIVSTAGALYVIPFLVFSPLAGVLADRFSKRKLIQVLKGTELIILTAALPAFYYKSPSGAYLLLFLLATHSALFGPPKYGILPELIEKAGLPKANGHITAFTYLAMIAGTFLASFFTEISGRNFLFGVFFCILFSLVGFLASLGIRKAPVDTSSSPTGMNFFGQIRKTLSGCRSRPLLLSSILGSGFFLFIGAFTQLNIIPFAISSLHLSEYDGGYLFLFTAVGIAVGSFLTGRYVKKRPSLGLSCMAGFAIGFLFLGLCLVSPFRIPVSVLLFLLGVFGGMFILSFDTFIQINSIEGKRGQTIAAANFLGFTGVLASSGFLYLSEEVWGLSPAAGFLATGVLTIFVLLFLSIRLGQVFFPFLARHSSLYAKTIIVDPLQALRHGSLFFLEHPSLVAIWTVCKTNPNHKILWRTDAIGSFSGIFYKLFPMIVLVPKTRSLEELLQQAKKLQEEETSVSVIFSEPIPPMFPKTGFPFFSFKEEPGYRVLLEQEGKNPVLRITTL